MSEDAIVVPMTVNVRVTVKPTLFLRNAGASVTEGEFQGTDYATNVAGGAPIVNVKRGGEFVGTGWISTQDIIAAMIDAIVAAVDEAKKT